MCGLCGLCGVCVVCVVCVECVECVECVKCEVCVVCVVYVEYTMWCAPCGVVVYLRGLWPSRDPRETPSKPTLQDNALFTVTSCLFMFIGVFHTSNN